MHAVFADIDIALDLLSERDTHYEYAAGLFTLADKGKLFLVKTTFTERGKKNIKQIQNSGQHPSCRCQDH